MNPKDLKYTESHEWVKVTGKIARIGISQYAQQQLGDIVYVELPSVGAKLSPKGQIGVVESVKTLSDVYSPVGGTVTATNGKLASDPALVNQDPYGDGWIVEIEMDAPADVNNLLDAAAYEKHCAEHGH